MTDAQRDDLEHQINCQCGCPLDVYTCRTTDFSCSVSPAMHADVMGLVTGGYSATEILAAFQKVYGERVLMSPIKSGFNWLGYVTPSIAHRSGRSRDLFAHSPMGRPRCEPPGAGCSEERRDSGRARRNQRRAQGRQLIALVVGTRCSRSARSVVRALSAVRGFFLGSGRVSSGRGARYSSLYVYPIGPGAPPLSFFVFGCFVPLGCRFFPFLLFAFLFIETGQTRGGRPPVVVGFGVFGFFLSFGFFCQCSSFRMSDFRS